MKISNVLQERRRLLGLTQEEVAEYLGVTTPAVNKWEKGSTCPDISLLAPLARLLKTDLNTLLGFYEEITEQELISICKAIREAVLANGLDAGFAIAQEQIRQYPNSDTLLYNSALQLQSLLAAAALTEDQVKAYMKQIEAWYERLAKCEDPVIRNNVCFILAGSAIARKEYEKAQAYLEGIPCRESMPDKRLLQAAIDLGQDRAGEAAKRLEQVLLRSLNDVQMILYKLIDANLALGDQKTAVYVAECVSKLAKEFDMHPYSALAASFQIEVMQQDAEKTIALLENMLRAMAGTWNIQDSPLYRHISETASGSSMREMMKLLLQALRQSPEFDFLRGNAAFESLLSEYSEQNNS